MKIIISDSSTLILLQKVDVLDLLLKNHEIIIPNEVYKEVVIKGKNKAHEYAFFIEEHIKDKKIKIIKVKNSKIIQNLVNNYNINQGEAEAIALFLEKKADIIAVDDHKAINICRIMKIPFMTPLSFIIYLLRKKLITKNKAKLKIQLLYQFGRYKDQIIIEALNEVSKWHINL